MHISNSASYVTVHIKKACICFFHAALSPLRMRLTQELFMKGRTHYQWVYVCVDFMS